MRLIANVSVLLVFGMALANPVRAEIIAEFDGGATNVALNVSPIATPSMAFEVTGNPTVTEVQLLMARWSGSAGFVYMQLRSDSNGKPASAPFATVTMHVNDLPYPAQWVSFKWSSSGTTLSPGRKWIVCKLSSGSDAMVHWISARDNPYGPGDDTWSSLDGGSTWSSLQGVDAYFKVFGTRTSESTTTTVTASPSTVATSGASTIQVTVRDSGNNLVQGPGVVDLSATAGSLGSTSLTLSNGQASTTWTAPASTGSRTVSATFPAFSWAGTDYQSSSGNTAVNVVAQQRSTTTAETLSPTSTTTRSSINVSATVRDSTSALVPGGTVSFTCSTGSFASSSVAVVSGTASTTWTAGNTAGTFAINASYSGHDTGAIVYGASTDSDNVSVDYTNVSTTTTVRVSPDHPYKSKSSYVIVEVKDSSARLVPGGTVQFSAPSGAFDYNTITLSGGMGSAVWYAPSSTGAVTITANYQQYIAGGNRYLTSSGNDTATVVKDNDSTGESLSWMSEWVAAYANNPLTNPQAESRGFTDKLTSSMSWAGSEYGDDNAYETDMKRSADGGYENYFMDVHDFTWYSGHGNPDYVTFITNRDDKKLEYTEAWASWGSRDADWMAFSACQVMSNPSAWAATMGGIHLECGFHTNASDTSTLGKVFAGFLIKDGVYDEPHKIVQAWFLAGDVTHANDKKQRVIGENGPVLDDYIWGQGYVVSPDPTVDAWYADSGIHDITSPQTPIANAGGPYPPFVAGQVGQLDGSGSSDADVGDYLFYTWDLDTTTNTDSGDWDNMFGDNPWDDADLWGPRPQVVFPAQGTYSIELTVRDKYWRTNGHRITVTVNPPPAGANDMEPAPQEPQTNGPIEIVDNFPSLPTETWMPVAELVGTTLGYNEMMSMAQYYGMQGSAGMDELGNWTMTDGDYELIVNQYTGGVMYVDRARAYAFPDPPPGSLPPVGQAISLADDFVMYNEITCDHLDYAGVTVSDVVFGEADKGGRTYSSWIPYQRRVNYGRLIDASGWGLGFYPVVGPGGKVTVLMDEYEHVLYFVKTCRDASLTYDIELHPPVFAIQDFHDLGLEALIGSSLVPPCNRIEIDNVSIGYYEDDFVTLQEEIYPVYVLDLTVEDDVGSQQVQVYLRADAPPIEVSINSPADETEVDVGTAISFSGSAIGGVPPYTYEWYSDIDDLLGTGANIQATLSINQREGEVLYHAVTLRVTDDAGWSKEDHIRVMVMPLVVQPPGLPADVQHQARKNRYISVDTTTNELNEVAIEVTLSSMKRCNGDLRRACKVDADCPGVCQNHHDYQCSTTQDCANMGVGGICIPTHPCIEHPDVGNVTKWVDAPFVSSCVPQFDCAGQSFAHLVDGPVYRVWTENTLHISDCEVIPAATFDLRTTADGATFSEPLTVGTIEKPHVHYGDCAGSGAGYTPPDGYTNVVDVLAYLVAFQGLPWNGHTTWVDLEGLATGQGVSVPQQILNVSDLQRIQFGFKGYTYQETPQQEDPGDCPP